MAVPDPPPFIPPQCPVDGHGVGIDDTWNNLLRYSLRVDDGLHKSLHHQKAPLVLAGVQYLFRMY
jgi:hypothetical protein